MNVSLRFAQLAAIAATSAISACSNGLDDSYYERQAAVMSAEAEGRQLQPAGNERADVSVPVGDNGDADLPGAVIR